jgi:hypothetical protein
MNLESTTTLLLQHAAELGKGGAETLEHMLDLAHSIEREDTPDDRSHEGAEMLICAASHLNGLSGPLRLVIGALVARARAIQDAAPLLAPLGETPGARFFTVNRTAGKLQVFLAALGTSLDGELERLKSETIEGACGKMNHRLNGEKLQALSRSPALLETAFARALIETRKLALPRDSFEWIIAGGLSQFGRTGATAPTFLRPKERIIGSTGNPRSSMPFVQGPMLDLLGVDVGGRTFRDSLSRAHFSRGEILAVNVAAFESPS